MKYDINKIDLDSLDELIGKCEDAMVRPFKKKKEIEVEIEPADEEEEEHDEASESEGKADLSDMDLDELVEMYKDLKEKKEEE